ncbi:ammonia-forming cytochrome c nitrite reductase subunit c552 [Campylobacter troglodytis]|uniref:ammonia-forming cytochrome c nitrite reductase subunit c552 n=1 Tax=Campylobacter troglodytis TaxID=654363 RepID=UPI00115AD3EC|nr:ammonia-forming cytochrome c nitrite reductase subunit c552 [Campylobacter troglodytis]TQR60876.1 ammonia-forming cytochrome c nitrite reductase subunit c552 [Campylobacter troglodytis]
MNKNTTVALIAILVLLTVGVLWLNHDISKKQNEGVGGIISKGLVEMSDDDPRYDVWGQNFPDYLDMYLTVEEEKPISTEFGGNLAYSKLIRYPQLTVLWAGYPFSIDANEERGHFWIQVDQMDTARNNKDFLNSHGFAGFNGQPAACMNCHSGFTPWLLKHSAKNDWVAFNSTKYWTMIKNIPALDGIVENSAQHSSPHGGKRMGVTCADCHSPDTMNLRLTRPAAINSLVARGYERDEAQGIKATREEMRSLVCAQCHTEYYFRPTGTKVKVMGESIANDASKKWFNGTQKTYDEFDSWRDGNAPTEIEVDGIELVFPWAEWKKGQPFRIEMFEDYYDKIRGVFPSDWTHKLTKADMIKIQHPETELYSGGVHAANGVSCADCHMPYLRKGAKKMTNHNVTSPLQDINSACKSCHTQSEDYLRAQILDIQKSVAFDLRSAEYATVSLIKDIELIRAELGKKAEFQTEGKADDKKISASLKEVLELHRRAQMRGDFVGAENSTGFHNPREASRMLLQAVEMARQGQTKLAIIASRHNIAYEASEWGFEEIQRLNPGELHYKVDLNGAKAGDRYYKHKEINSNPPSKYLQMDKDTKPYKYTVLD